MSDGSEDPIDKQLKEIAKRMETILHARMSHISEQLQTIVNDIEEIRHRVNATERAILLSSENSKYLLRNVSLLTQELDAVETYMARTDPVLRDIIANGIRLQQEELKARKMLGNDKNAAPNGNEPTNGQ